MIQKVRKLSFDEDTDNPNNTYLRLADNSFLEPEWSTLCQLAGEMNTLAPWLIEPDGEVVVEVNTADVYARCWSKSADATSLLIICNATANKKTAALSFPQGFDIQSYQSLLGSPEPQRFTSDGLEVALEGYGAGIYRAAMRASP